MFKCWQVFAAGMLVLLAQSVMAGKEEISEEDFSGFLGDYTQLQHSEKQNVYRWANREKLMGYQKIHLQPVVVYPVEQANAEVADKATHYMNEGLEKILDKHGLRSDDKGDGVLQLRAAITGSSKEKVGMKAYNFIPVALVFRAGQAATGNVASYIQVSMEVEMLDAQSGERVAAAVLKGIGETEKTSGDEFGYEDIVPVMDLWLANFENFLLSLY